MIENVSESARVFLVPSPRLGPTADVVPERIGAGMNDWIGLSREILAKKRDAAARGWQPTSEISEDHAFLRPFGAQHCPALQEAGSIGWMLKWPASATFRNVSPRAWEIHAPPENLFYKHHGQSSFPEAGLSDAVSISLGWMIVTPPGFSTLIKNLPNNLVAPHPFTFAEGVVRTDRATIPLQVHAFLAPHAPKEFAVKRGDPMCLVMPFRREKLELAVMDDPASIEEASRLAREDQETFANAPGRYRALYVDGDELSPLWESLSRKLDGGT
jgi:hypothetical protein